LTTLQTTVHEKIPVGAGRGTRAAVKGGGGPELLLVAATDFSAIIRRLKMSSIWSSVCEQVHCVNAFRMGSNNSSCAWKSCACASIAFLAHFLVCGQ
jgi:hypothetical protein